MVVVRLLVFCVCCWVGRWLVVMVVVILLLLLMLNGVVFVVLMVVSECSSGWLLMCIVWLLIVIEWIGDRLLFCYGGFICIGCIVSVNVLLIGVLLVLCR